MMGRKPRKPNSIPRLRARRRASGRTWYYYDHGIVDGRRKEEPLGSDYGLAIQRWAELERAGQERVLEVVTFRHVAERYRAEVIPTKAPETQRGNLAELANLLSFFDDPPAPLDAIKPLHVAQYLEWRKSAPVRANRERALLSHIWNFARRMGYTAQANPCAGVRGNTEKGRDAYLSDAEYQRIWGAADDPLRDAMDLAYLTGQRPGDVLRMSESDIHGGELHIRQGKTGAKLRMQVSDELAAVLARIRTRKAGQAAFALRLVVNEAGQPLSVAAISRRWAKACATAGVVGYQFRDLRAKAASDKEETAGIRDAQHQLGHTTVTMTEHYARKRRGAPVTPTR